ncbi:hypothetical protein [Deinococcus daejeonensis]|uniref:Uncharacterized protein n=1 Tax=Deinococcus daejeonensis TaxID=1007098 RepID=A0ABQ2IVB4_9DEIO|nr:hypothetical protein [Deinococcus daejeonensis]AWT35867.1 hypothetical protein DM785_10075 [Deinococcus actinosclerus]GGN27415.1 hypothetical protein GCM10010842_00320 [Deinococcus daejeonensis]
MNDTTAPRALSRTWETLTLDRMDGAVVQTRAHTVTLTRTPAGIEAQVNGEACDLTRAVGILQGADTVTVTAQTLEAPTIGKARAAGLHRLMARAGVPSGEHYGFAGAALDRAVFSLAALTEGDARAVWAFLRATFPQVRAA